MNHTEHKNRSISWLEKKSRECKTRPFRFTPKEVSDAIGGSPTALGVIQEEIVIELKARGVGIRYLRQGGRRVFEFF